MTECGGPVALDRHQFATQRLGLVVERSARAVPPGAALGCGGTPTRRCFVPMLQPRRALARAALAAACGATLVPIAGALAGAPPAGATRRGGRRPPCGPTPSPSRSRPSRRCSTATRRRTPSSASAWPRSSRRRAGVDPRQLDAVVERGRPSPDGDRPRRPHASSACPTTPGADPRAGVRLLRPHQLGLERAGVGLPHQSSGQIRGAARRPRRRPAGRPPASTPAT